MEVEVLHELLIYTFPDKEALRTENNCPVKCPVLIYAVDKPDIHNSNSGL